MIASGYLVLVVEVIVLCSRGSLKTRGKVRDSKERVQHRRRRLFIKKITDGYLCYSPHEVKATDMAQTTASQPDKD